MRLERYNKFPTTKRNIHVGDIWYAFYPYKEEGNFEKLRPVLVSAIKEDKIKVRMITSNPKSGKLIVIKNKVKSRLLYKDSYLTNDDALLTEDKFYSKIVASCNYDVKKGKEND